MSSVLYDAPGPRTRRRILWSSLVAAVVVLALLALVVARLADGGQFARAKWSPLVDPGDPVFSQVWRLIGQGLKSTLVAAALAMVLSLLIGTALAVVRLLLRRMARLPVVGLIELLRGVPVVITIFFAYRVLPELGLDLASLWYLVIGLTGYNAVIIAEIVRAGVASLPRGQTEAAYAIGLTRWQTMREVLLPQAVRVMLPALISQLVVVLKDTSLVAVLGGYTELLRQGQLIIQNLGNPIQVFFVVALLFVVINYALSRLAVYVERRLSRGRRRTAGVPPAADAQSDAVTGA